MARHRILLLGLMGRFPMAGIGWQALHYIIGLERLGFDVFYVEDSGAPPYDPRVVGLGTDAASNVAFVRETMARTNAPDHWVYWDALTDTYHGLGREALVELYASCDQIWNLCGATRLRDEHQQARVRVYIQTDPGFEQIRIARGDARYQEEIDAHDLLFTYGESLGSPGAVLPTCGRTWHATRPPVLLDHWSAGEVDPAAPFTTVGSWSNAGKDESWHGTTQRWSKDAAFRAVRDVPARAGQRVEAAMSPPPDVALAMEASGWTFRDPREVSLDLDRYRAFVHGSCGEFTVAKEVYASTRSGWFSDRSATYLASGRPVVTTDTGAPVGAGAPGLRTFRTAHEAVDALRDVGEDLRNHARGARVLASAHFDASRVLGAMLAVISP